MEELRAGMGNALWGKYAHTSTFDLKITDAMFNLEYLAANVGSAVEHGGDVFRDETLTSNGSGEITLTATAVPIQSSGVVYAYVRLAGQGGDKRTKVQVNGNNKLTGLLPNTEYCVRYMYSDASASKVVINSNFIPSTLSVILTANLYSGDSCNQETSTKVGTLTIKVPRFQLNGNQELSMSATGIAQTSFEGSALASGCTGCDDNGVYAEIIQVLLTDRWFTQASGLVIEDSYIEANAAGFDAASASPVVYAWYASGAPKLMTNAILAAQESHLSGTEKTSLVYSIVAGSTGLDIDSSTGVLSGSPAAGTATIKVVAQMNSAPIPGMEASATIVLS